MKKQELEDQLIEILKESEQLKARWELEVETADFLINESERLIKKKESGLLSYEEQELLDKQIQALYSRLRKEIETMDSDVIKVKKLESKVEDISTILLITPLED